MGRRQAGAAPAIRVDRGYARVWIGGRFHSLGACPNSRPTLEQMALAARLWQEHLTGVAVVVSVTPASRGIKITAPETPEGLTIAEVGLRYLEHCRVYYQTEDGKVTSSVAGVEMALRALFAYADTVAAMFGARALKNVQAGLVAEGRPRVTVNRVIKTIRRVFRWAASEELVPVSVCAALETVQPLQKGRTPAPELAKIGEVADSVVDDTLPHLPPTIAAMVLFQRWTGARPGEVCLIRPCDIDRSGDVWVYSPHHHKLSWREDHSDRRITIGVNGQKILKPFLLRPAEAYCFSPQDSERKRANGRRESRQSPLTPSQRARKPKASGQRRPGRKYVTDSYRRAISRGIELANEARKASGQPLIPKWAPNQIRHLRAGEVKQAMGIETASAVLGHANLRTTEIYADRKLELSKEASRRLG